jgi:hypothetical protein
MKQGLAFARLFHFQKNLKAFLLSRDCRKGKIMQRSGMNLFHFLNGGTGIMSDNK